MYMRKLLILLAMLVALPMAAQQDAFDRFKQQQLLNRFL